MLSCPKVVNAADTNRISESPAEAERKGTESSRLNHHCMSVSKLEVNDVSISHQIEI